MVYVFLAEGFEEMEALAPIDILRRAGLSVQTVGIGGREITGSHGVTFIADVADDAFTPDDMEAVVLPGGMPGTKNLESARTVSAALNCAVRENVVVAAICAAPSILGHKGFLQGKRATCYPGFESELHGAEVTGESVVVDGRFVTASGAGAALDFALALVSCLRSEQEARHLREVLQCP